MNRPKAHTYCVLTRRPPREPEVAMACPTLQGLCPLQVNAPRRIGDEIQPADVGQDVLVAMLRRELAEAAGLVLQA